MFTDIAVCSYIYSIKPMESRFGANILRRPTYWNEAICEDYIEMASVNGCAMMRLKNNDTPEKSVSPFAYTFVLILIRGIFFIWMLSIPATIVRSLFKGK